MGPKVTGKNKKLQMKKTSTPLNATNIKNTLPPFENISTVKVSRKKNFIFSSESAHKPQLRSRESATFQTILKKKREPRRDSAVVSKISCKLRPDTPLKPRKYSQQSSSLISIQKKLKFSQPSNSSNPIYSSFNDDNCLMDKFSFGIDESDSRSHLKTGTSGNAIISSIENQAEYYLNDSTVLVEDLVCKEENCDKSLLSGDILLPASLDSKELEKDKHQIKESFIRERSFEVNAVDTSDSIEICRRDTSGLEMLAAVNSLHLDLSCDESTQENCLKENSLKENCYNILNLEKKSVLYPDCENDVKRNGMRESKSDVRSAKPPDFKVMTPLRKSSRLKKFKKGNNSNVPKDDCNRIDQVPLEGDEANILIDTNEPSNEEKAKVLQTFEKNSAVVYNDKGVYEHKSSFSHACNSNESSCTKFPKKTGAEYRETSQFYKIYKSRLKITRRTNDENTNKNDKRSTAANSRKSKSTLSRVNEKRGGKSKKEPSNTRVKRHKQAATRDTYSFPITSTPVSSFKTSHKCFENNSSRNQTPTENSSENCSLDDLRITGIKASKVYGKLSKTRRKSEASRRWEFLAKKGRRDDRVKITKNRTRDLNNFTDKSNRSLFCTPPLILLENVPIDEGLRLRSTKREADKKRKNTKSRKRLYDSKKFQQLASHFDDISKHSLVTEVEF